MLIAGRMIQALGAGPIGPLMTVVIMNMFPVENRGKAMGFIGLAMNFAPAIGPTLSGWIVQTYDWRSIFYVVLPLAVINIVVAFFALKNDYLIIRFDIRLIQYLIILQQSCK